MTSLPLHPALVHIPLGLAFVVPALAVLFALTLWLQFARRARSGDLVPLAEVVTVSPRRPGARAWIVVVALQAVLFGAGLVAMNTGEREEERVEQVVPETAIARHEEYAEQFVWAAGLTLALAGLVLVFRKPPAALFLVTTTAVASLIVAALAVRVGQAGGELVYVYNAGAAYASPRASITETRATIGSDHEVEERAERAGRTRRR